MPSLRSVPNRIAWLVIGSYLVIVLVELLILRTLGGTPQANLIRYLTFSGVVAASVWIVRQRVVKPIQEMTRASRRIAEGDYHTRLPHYASPELASLASAFNQMSATIEATEQQRVALIGDVAHELRTPLASLRATMEALQDGVLPQEPATYASIQREVMRLQRLVQQLEGLSRAESGQLAVRHAPVTYDRLVREVAARLAGQFEAKGVALDVALPATLPTVSADADLLAQLLTNLLGNALQYTPSGGSVQLQVEPQGDQLLTRVRDSGIGIPQEALPRLFERFYRVDRSRARCSGGSGIGLTIARHLVQAHGGRLWAESEGPGRGATFSFTLPLHR